MASRCLTQQERKSLAPTAPSEKPYSNNFPLITPMYTFMLVTSAWQKRSQEQLQRQEQPQHLEEQQCQQAAPLIAEAEPGAQCSGARSLDWDQFWALNPGDIYGRLFILSIDGREMGIF